MRWTSTLCRPRARRRPISRSSARRQWSSGPTAIFSASPRRRRNSIRSSATFRCGRSLDERRRGRCDGSGTMTEIAAADEAAESYGIFTAAAVQDPYPAYRRLREDAPVHWSEKAQAWYFTLYRDVFALQARPDLSVDRVETLYSYLPQAATDRFSSI